MTDADGLRLEQGSPALRSQTAAPVILFMYEGRAFPATGCVSLASSFGRSSRKTPGATPTDPIRVGSA
jgi:hypothetical protein